MTKSCFISQQEMPRERLITHGTHTLTTAELLALILGTGSGGLNAVQFSGHLLQNFNGSLRQLLSADFKQLTALKGLGQAKSCQLLAIQELAKRALEEELKEGISLNSPDNVKSYCSAQLGALTIEHCIALLLDSQFRLLHTCELSKGTLSQAAVYPRELVRHALRHHAGAVILVHNHPSGVLSPSLADINLTRHIKQALNLVDVRLIDHIIVANGKTYSFAENSQLD